jgi:two-component system, response regulator
MNDAVILLVEDDPKDQALALRAFKKNNIRNPVIVAQDGVEALDYLFARGAHAGREVAALPQVVLLDLKLPKVDGIEVLRQIRRDPRTELVPVVMLTSSREERDVIETYRLGANSYIVKPIDFDQFVEAARVLGLYWLVLNETPPRKT